jgi:hypothetical protein
MKEISLLKLKPTKQLWNLNPSMKELFIHWNSRRRNSTCRFAIAIIGDEDVTVLIAAKSEPKTESESAKPKIKSPTTPEATKEEKQHYSACSLPEGVVIVTMPRLSDTMKEQ